MSDFGWYLAAALGFALVCVMTVVWLLSKRTVQVNQHQENHAAPVTVNAVTETGSLGIAPTLIGWAFKLIVGGFVFMLLLQLANSVLTSVGNGSQSIGDGMKQQPRTVPVAVTAIPTVAATVVPTAIATRQPVEQPHAVPAVQPVARQEHTAALVVLGVFAIAAIGLWSYIAAMLVRNRQPRRVGTQTDRTQATRMQAAHTQAARDRRLEEIIPDAVKNL